MSGMKDRSFHKSLSCLLGLCSIAGFGVCIGPGRRNPEDKFSRNVT